VSERRERSFLRRARDARHEMDPESAADAPGPATDDREDSAPGDPDYRVSAPGESGAASQPTEGGGFRRGSELRRAMALAGERIDEIIATAHQMAGEIRREAEAEADRYIEMRRREAELIVEERLAGVRAALGALRVEIDGIERRIIAEARGGGQTPAAEPERYSDNPRRPQEEGVRVAAYPGTAGEGGSVGRAGRPPNDERAAALIRASQLAVQGESRDRIEAVLRDDFGIERPDEIVDDILPKPR
jgi:hypothetical protein